MESEKFSAFFTNFSIFFEFCLLLSVYYKLQRKWINTIGGKTVNCSDSSSDQSKINFRNKRITFLLSPIVEVIFLFANDQITN